MDTDADAAEIVFDLTAGVDQVTLSSTGATQLTLESTNGSFEDHAFDFTGVTSITINMLGGNDALTLQSLGGIRAASPSTLATATTLITSPLSPRQRPIPRRGAAVETTGDTISVTQTST